MSLYFGGTRVKTYLNGVLYDLNLYNPIMIAAGVSLLSSDDFILMDNNGVYLTAIPAPGVLCGEGLCGEIMCGGAL